MNTIQPNEDAKFIRAQFWQLIRAYPGIDLRTAKNFFIFGMDALRNLEDGPNTKDILTLINTLDELLKEDIEKKE